MARVAELERVTKETSIWMRLDLDGAGEAKLDYPVGFMAHMLKTFAGHGLFDIEVRASGDLEVDQHHLVEDTGLVLGQCFARALGDKRGIRRVGNCLFPMDEALVRAVVDISGRPFLVLQGEIPAEPLVSAPAGEEASYFQTDTVEDFWQGFTSAAGITLHLDVVRGRSAHHIIEALFKAAARALREASEIDLLAPDQIPSIKGVLA